MAEGVSRMPRPRCLIPQILYRPGFHPTVKDTDFWWNFSGRRVTSYAWMILRDPCPTTPAAGQDVLTRLTVPIPE